MNVRRDRTVQAVLALTLLAVALRVAFLGSRVAHWDEARVAYWIVEYSETGVLFYRPIIHGPLLHLVNAPLFELFGKTDFVMRLFPALVGAALPLTALMFRHRLRDETVVALAFFLALDPVLLYYSRFMRNDIITAAFCFVAFACFVRAIDFDDGRYLYGATAALALAFAAKENPLAYLMAFAGAAVLLLHHRLLFARLTDREPLNVAQDYLAWALGGVIRQARSIAGSIALFLLVFIYAYAPRGKLPSQGIYYRSCTGYEGYFDVAAAPTLSEALANPLQLPRLVSFTLGSTAELYGCQWITPRADDPNPYLEFLGELSLLTAEASTAVIVLAVVGFLATLYSSELPDDLVSFSFYWGAASVVGYPFVADIGGAGWLAVHIVLPLTIPAAFAFGLLYRWGRDAERDEDLVSVALVVVIAIVLVGSVAWTGYATSFADPKSDSNPLVQYAQPSGDVEATLADMRTLADQNEGTDAVLYGEHFHSPTGGEELERRPVCSNWFNALPLPWYFEASDMDVDCAPDNATLDEQLADDPPVVIAHSSESAAVDERIPDRYDRRVFLMRSSDTPFVFYVDESQLE
ncbi:MAG: hypothetical protein ACI8UR_001346 [Natronomonas sp.]|jgi:uncharacterized protein (TIGR03663 family)|uniref:flippase activity-associated protein Agl23 n=1 Tax=Natronomonas sp. TaxID=2184060 RepID=UPI003989F640